MGKRMALLLVLCLLSACGASDAPERRQTDDREPRWNVGADAADDGGVTLTAGDGSRCLQAGAATVGAAARELDRISGEAISAEAVGALLVGETLAARDIAPYLGEIEDLPEGWLDIPIYIVCGGRAETLLYAQGENTDFGGSEPCSARDIITQTQYGGGALCPALMLAEAANGTAVTAAGYAAMENYRLLGYLRGEAAGGVELVANRVPEDAVIEIEGEDGSAAALQIRRSESEIVPKLENGALRRVEIRLDIEAWVEELRESDTEELARQLEKVANLRMKWALERAQDWRCDFLGLGARVSFAWPAEGEKDWDARFPELEIVLGTKARVYARAG